ncbi:GNAT family N-acetyltransferase [Aeromicrobium sp.]|uniref:GNAT family N-acetyltransferase n=1 Tax=Aeromicrobium sp. TaxID=1871063 RepID=UPI003C3F229D
MTTVRLATPDDAETVARMLHDFNEEFGTPTPGVEFLTTRCRELIDAEEMTVVLGGDPPVGVGVLFFRPSLWSRGEEAYLAELYVVPDRRDDGIGGAMMATAMDLSRERGATDMQIGVDEPDVDTRRFYERLGFRNHDPEDPTARMFFYEREL